MKNKILFIGSLCLIMALGLVMGSCQVETQTLEYKSVGGPKNVVAVKVAATTLKDAHIKVTWDVNPDASGYDVVFQQDGKKSYDSAGSGGWYEYTTAGAIVDQDKYVAEIDLDYAYKGTFKIGVVAYPRRNDQNPSKPVWAKDLITVP